jgi:hypothetical protein
MSQEKRSTKIYLVFPDHKAATQCGYRRRRTPVTWMGDHPLSLFGLGVLLDEFGDSFDWSWFRALHHKTGACLETSDHITMLRVLGLFAGEIRNLSDYIRPLNHTESGTPRAGRGHTESGTPRAGRGYRSADQGTLTID